MSFQLVIRSAEHKRSNVDSELGFDPDRHRVRVQPRRHRLTWLSGLHERAQVNFPQLTTPSRRTEGSTRSPTGSCQRRVVTRRVGFSWAEPLSGSQSARAVSIGVAVNKTRIFIRRRAPLKRFRESKSELTWFAAVEACCDQMRLGSKITLDLFYSVIDWSCSGTCLVLKGKYRLK